MTILSYKDYQGSVSFEDGCLLIQLLHVDDFVATECDAASSAQSAFESMVEDYLETCKGLGKEPSKPFKGSFNIRVTPALHRAAAVDAARQNRTLNAWVVEAIELRLRPQSPPSAFALWTDVSAIVTAVTEMQQARLPIQQRRFSGVSPSIRTDDFARVAIQRERGRTN